MRCHIVRSIFHLWRGAMMGHMIMRRQDCGMLSYRMPELAYACTGQTASSCHDAPLAEYIGPALRGSA